MPPLERCRPGKALPGSRDRSLDSNEICRTSSWRRRALP
jgi:hypothetical protein